MFLDLASMSIFLGILKNQKKVIRKIHRNPNFVLCNIFTITFYFLNALDGRQNIKKFLPLFPLAFVNTDEAPILMNSFTLSSSTVVCHCIQRYLRLRDFVIENFAYETKKRFIFGENNWLKRMCRNRRKNCEIRHKYLN